MSAKETSQEMKQRIEEKMALADMETLWKAGQNKGLYLDFIEWKRRWEDEDQMKNSFYLVTSRRQSSIPFGQNALHANEEGSFHFKLWISEKKE